MGLLTLDDFRTDLRTALGGRRVVDPVTTDAWLDRRINQGYLYICQPNVYKHRELNQGETIALVADQRNYDITNQIYAAHDVRIVETVGDPATRIRRLEPLTLRQFRFENEVRPQAGMPEYFTLTWNSVTGVTRISLLPQPDATFATWSLVFTSWIRPTLLAAPGDQTVLRDDWDHILTKAATWYGFDLLGDVARKEFAKEDLDAMVNNQIEIAKVELEDFVDGTPTVIIEPYVEETSLW